MVYPSPMRERTCAHCGETFPVPDRFVELHGPSGHLIMAGPEEPIHRCPTLTRDDERMLLQDADWAFGSQQEDP